MPISAFTSPCHNPLNFIPSKVARKGKIKAMSRDQFARFLETSRAAKGGLERRHDPLFLLLGAQVCTLGRLLPFNGRRGLHWTRDPRGRRALRCVSGDAQKWERARGRHEGPTGPGPPAT